MLHDTANRSNHVFKAANKRGFLPAPGMAFDAHPIGSCTQSGEAYAIVTLGRLTRCLGIGSSEDQMISMNPDGHPGGNEIVFDKLGELSLGALHR